MLFNDTIYESVRNRIQNFSSGLILLLMVSAFAILIPCDAATYYSAELDYLPRGARSLSMGGTGCASVNDAYSPFYNPAAMAEIARPELMVEYTPLWDLGDDFGTGSLVYPFESRMAVGAYYSRLQINGINYFGELSGNSTEERYNDETKRSTGQPLGTFYDAYEVYSISMAKWISTKISQEVFYKLTIPVTISGGASIKLFRQTFAFEKSLGQQDYVGQTSDLDAGFLITLDLDKDLATKKPTKIFKLGYSIKNLLGAEIKWNTDRNYSDDVERIRLLGISYTNDIPIIKGELNLAMDFIRQGNYQTERYGLEYSFMNRLFLRGGWIGDGFTAGVGLKYRAIGIDYAYRRNELSNNPYQLSLSISF